MERITDKDRIEQSIDLSEIYGREPTIEEKVEFADAFKNEVIDRTQKSLDYKGKKFPSYEDDYAEFKGVSVDDVDLTLFGDMLDSLQTEIRGSSVVLKVGESQEGKAHGNITGSYGQDSPNPKKARDFFGLTRDDAERLARKVQTVREDTTLIDILGTAPPPDVPEELNFGEILRSIGLFND